MSTEITIALIGIVSTFVSWLLGRRRTNAEIASMQMDYIEKANIFYNNRIDELQKEVRKLERQTRGLKLLIDKMLDDACLVKGCSKRVYYTPDILKEVMSAEDGDVLSIHVKPESK